MTKKAKKAAPAPALGRGKAIAAYFDPSVSLQLKQLGLELNDRSVQDLLGEALNLLFAKYKKPQIALSGRAPQ
jgi:hypothetical protein